MIHTLVYIADTTCPICRSLRIDEVRSPKFLLLRVHRPRTTDSLRTSGIRWSDFHIDRWKCLRIVFSDEVLKTDIKSQEETLELSMMKKGSVRVRVKGVLETVILKEMWGGRDSRTQMELEYLSSWNVLERWRSSLQSGFHQNYFISEWPAEEGKLQAETLRSKLQEAKVALQTKWLGWEIGWNRYFWYVIWLYRMIFSRLMSILLIHISKTWFKAKRTAWGFILPESASRKQIRQNQMKTVAVEIS